MEIIRYSLIGKEDLSFGKGTFAARLADGRMVTLSQIDLGAILSDASLSTQGLTLGAITVDGLTTPTVAFPAVQVPSADVHTLDDYEEGNWIPSVGGTATYTVQSGKYVKIGKLVFVTCALTINALGTGSNAAISGLPFISETDGALAVTGMLSLAVPVVYISGRILSGQSIIYLNSLLAAGTDIGTNGVLGNGTNVEVSGCYTTT